jgi:cell wall-associated NlpC family hydrolase
MNWLAVVAGMAVLLAGCAAPVGTLPPAPPPPGWASPQEAALEQAIRSYLGAPYKSGGTDPTGVDCSGLVQGAFRQAGIGLPRTVAEQFTVGRPVAWGELRFGDVLFFNRLCQTAKGGWFSAGLMDPGRLQEVCHNGIYLGNGRFVHAAPRGVSVTPLEAEVWRASFAGARRYLPGPP